ncbi:Flavohemoprotein [Frankliniella fusca]|uniref:Flavohemoprotein n=1 Tax=Frankliniella fusca TaxID=407009 RepID=A0AAE1HP34_9NEOP|nr:Flavohemoprotein [Frankliniella fusca]
MEVKSIDSSDNDKEISKCFVSVPFKSNKIYLGINKTANQTNGSSYETALQDCKALGKHFTRINPEHNNPIINVFDKCNGTPGCKSKLQISTIHEDK